MLFIQLQTLLYKHRLFLTIVYNGKYDILNITVCTKNTNCYTLLICMPCVGMFITVDMQMS